MNSSSHDRTSELNRVIGLCRRIFDEYQLSYVEKYTGWDSNPRSIIASELEPDPFDRSGTCTNKK